MLLEPVGFENLLEAPINPLLRIAEFPTKIEEESVWLVAGEVSPLASSRFQAGTVSQSLEANRISSAVWRDGTGLYIKPIANLKPQEVYTVLSFSLGHLGSVFTVKPPARKWFLRGAEALRPLGYAFVCQTAESMIREVQSAETRKLEPLSETSSLRTTPLPLREEKKCQALQVLGEGTWILGTDSMSPIDNSLLIARGENCEELSPLAMNFCHQEMKPCVEPGKQSVMLHLERGIHYVHSPSNSFIVELAESETVHLYEIEAGQTIKVESYSAQGCRVDRIYKFEPGQTVYSLAIEEVLANPAGPEPQSEWVELRNYGSKSILLHNYLLKDEGGETRLPQVELLKGQSALIVRTDFSPGAGLDIVPHSDAVAVPVDAIGKSGLSNSGERLELINASGVVVSRFPGGATLPGISQVRKYPELSLFTDHPAPGASPGY